MSKLFLYCFFSVGGRGVEPGKPTQHCKVSELNQPTSARWQRTGWYMVDSSLVFITHFLLHFMGEIRLISRLVFNQFFFFHQHRYVSQIYLLKYRSEIENKITRVLCSHSQDTTDYFQSFSNWLKCWLLDYSIKFFRSANRTKILKPIITILSL